jgi:hypothetical protein
MPNFALRVVALEQPGKRLVIYQIEDLGEDVAAGVYGRVSSKPPLKVQMRGIHFGSQITHLEESTKTKHPPNRTLVKQLIL